MSMRQHILPVGKLLRSSKQNAVPTKFTVSLKHCSPYALDHCSHLGSFVPLKMYEKISNSRCYTLV